MRHRVDSLHDGTRLCRWSSESEEDLGLGKSRFGSWRNWVEDEERAEGVSGIWRVGKQCILYVGENVDV